ncbi:eukaryotic translation initiation factor 2C, putative [Talaromyces stipitatus ATCC 10500]|uniref:Eukaryotic translation initiation factor 2C, putative n=1 Tax=Talaromyces stipitatus (strain ATCC 10500 / CBS 375.48 / QM 6759 / NRRL 1006) TaxID=441959 RepID=B8MGF3_TALSN|nr:eukaryotic translation initiation factor 2C, putative [Talaromyces stipitatus ATCC 10500]EED16273.1 eukaryotic translation initiation factor 2C, putative [Talaromyces stipitatus ATCC 10500]
MLADKDFGIHTICSVGSKLVKDRGRDQYMANVALKFNLKLGGINQIVENRNLGIVDENKTMVVGTDVTHPSPSSSSNAPSVSAMVASIDKFLGQWPATLRIQHARQENVTDLTEMFKSRLNLWKTKGTTEEKVNVALVARTYGVDPSNLRKRLRKVTGPKEAQYDNQRLLSGGQSQALIRWINHLTEKGLPPTNSMLANFAKDICGKKPGKNWASRWLKSHSDQVISRYSTGLDMDRKKGR